MINPKTYYEWNICINELKKGVNDDEVIDAMMGGEISWSPGVADRFSKKFLDAVNYRINKATDKFNKEINNAMGEENLTVVALASVRRELSYLYKLVQLPCIPKKICQEYMAIVKNQADKMQNSLEESAKEERTGRLEKLVKSNRVNNL